MQALGYENQASFRKTIGKAKQSCIGAGLACEDHMIRQSDGTHIFTRFGCYLVAMNGSPAKGQVAAAQAYFAALAQTFQSHLEHADGIDRILMRSELTDGQKSLNGTAHSHGVENYAFFLNQGYVGLYNMGLKQLLSKKGIDGSGSKLMDHMGRQELAANLFRITQTDARIKNQNLRGQTALEGAAFDVGRRVRKMMDETSQTRPENLPLAQDLKSVKKQIKKTSKTLNAPLPKGKKKGGEK